MDFRCFAIKLSGSSLSKIQIISNLKAEIKIAVGLKMNPSACLSPVFIVV